MRTFLFVLCFLFLATPVLAGHVGLYSTATATECAVVADDEPGVDGVAGVIEVYVVVTGTPGVTQTTFRVELDSGLLALVGWTSLAWLCAGACDPETGLNLIAQSCVQGSWVVARLVFVKTTGRVASCDQLRVLGAPGDDPLVFDCDGTPAPATGGTFSFMDGPNDCETCLTPLPVEATTWGRVKALYR